MSLFSRLQADSYTKGTVTLASGKTSDFYIDCRKTFLTQEGMNLCASALVQRLRELAPKWGIASHVAGTGLGGAVLASAMVQYSLHSGNRLDMIYVRSEQKDHGKRNLIETPAGFVFDSPEEPSKLFPGVVLVEDVVTTGGSALKACLALKEAGLCVRGCIAVVDREEGASEAFATQGVALSSLFTRADFERDG